MKKVLAGGFALALVFLVSGCADSPDSVMKDTIKLLNETADVLEGITDKDSAEKAKPKLEALQKKAKSIKERAEKLKMNDMSKEKKEELTKKYKDDLFSALARVAKAQNKITDPEVKKMLSEMDLK